MADGLLDLQHGGCFYCLGRIAAKRQIDHFIPWSHSGDDGLDNLVAACHRCNNEKRATLPAPGHLADLMQRNQASDGDLAALAEERRWPRDRLRSARIAQNAYLRSPDERPLWRHSPTGDRYENLGAHREALMLLLG